MELADISEQAREVRCKKVAASGKGACEKTVKDAITKAKGNKQQVKLAKKAGAMCEKTVAEALAKCDKQAGASKIVMGVTALTISAAMLF